jgi:hypothetical protein
MRSVRGLLAAAAFLLILPSAALMSMLFDVEAEITVHFVAAIGFALLALSVFDFQTPRWLTWAAAAAGSISALTYALQGMSNLLPNNEALQYVALHVLGQQLERVLPDVLILWFVGLLLTDSKGKTKVLGFGVLAPIVAIELLSYGFSLFGGSINEAVPLLKVALLLPFVWLACESAQKPSGNAPTTGLLRLSAVSA